MFTWEPFIRLLRLKACRMADSPLPRHITGSSIRVTLYSLVISDLYRCDFSGKALAYSFDDLYGGLMISHKYSLPSKDYPGTSASFLFTVRYFESKIKNNSLGLYDTAGP